MAFITDIQFQQHVNIVREEFKNRQILLTDSGPPGSLKAPVGAFYLDIASNDRYEKIDVNDGDWQLYTSENAQGAWQPIASNYTAANDEKLMVDTSVISIEITLPPALTAAPGDVVWFVDYLSSFQSNNLILKGNGSNIMSSPTDFSVNVNDVLFLVMFINVSVGWKIFSFSD